MKNCFLRADNFFLSFECRRPRLLNCSMFVLVLFIIILSGCSSQPKRVMEVSVIRTACATSLETANACILTGDFENAEKTLEGCYTQAMSIDNAPLLVSVSLARVSLRLSQNPPDVAGARAYLADAKNFAKYCDDTAKQNALCTMNGVRISLEDGTFTDYESLNTILDECDKDLKQDKYNEAHLSSIRGDICRKQKDYSQAEKYFSDAVKKYSDNRYLAEIGLTWYKIAQVRSLAKNNTGALEALDNAISFDRASENTRALGIDYYIKGIIYSRIDKIPEAKYSFEHSADIFNSINLEDLANRSRNCAQKL